MIAPLLVALGGRKVMDGEAFISSFKDTWNNWEIQVTICLSLSIQVFLILTGNRRKHSRHPVLIFFIWIAYLIADSVAIYAVSAITSKLTQSTNPKTDLDVQLTVFWAPFLLLHLGGPDTITAFSLEDNELWLRHLLSLLTQAAVTLYASFMVWNGSNLSILTIAMIIAGLFKYGERVLVLRAGSTEHFRNSIPDPVYYFSEFVEEQKLREAEGFIVVPYEVNAVPEGDFEYNFEEPVDYSSEEKGLEEEKKYKRCQGEMLAARGMVAIFQRLFADLLISFQDRGKSLALLKGKNVQVTFKIVEIELGLMFDMFYTKAKAIHTRWGIARRIVVILFSAFSLVMFSSMEAHSDSYSLIDVAVTFVLLGVAILLEVYALMFLVFSDKAACWLIKTKKFKTLDAINCLRPLWKRRRWSGKVAQFSLLSFCFREKHLFCDQLLKLLRMDENIEKHMYKSHKKVSDELKQLIIESIKGSKSIWDTRGSPVLEKLKQKEKIGWSIEMEFDQSILIWHIATELYLITRDPSSISDMGVHDKWETILRCKISSLLSRYMMYLLVFYPLMLPIGIGRLKFKDTYIETMKFFDDLKSARDEARNALSFGEGCEKLRLWLDTKLNLTMGMENKSKFVLFHGCKLASQLDEMEDIQERWELLSEVWVEMLLYAASKCKGSYHCQQLRRGGELLTHVWLLLAHFGLTDHFQIPNSFSIAELIVT